MQDVADINAIMVLNGRWSYQRDAVHAMKEMTAIKIFNAGGRIMEMTHVPYKI